jgi:hypothetical protein
MNSYTPTRTLWVASFFGGLMLIGVTLELCGLMPKVGHFIYNFALGSVFPVSLLFATARQSSRSWRLVGDCSAIGLLAWIAVLSFLSVDSSPEYLADVRVIVHSGFLSLPALLFAIVATVFGRPTKNV